MNDRGHPPPRVARWLMSLWVDRNELDFIWADIGERYSREVTTDGRRAALRRLIREVRESFEPWSSLRAERAEGTITRPSSRRERRPPLLDRALRDAWYAIRSLRARPLFGLVAALTLAVGIGANAAIFGVVNGVLLRGVDGLSHTAGLVDVVRDVDGSFFDLSYPVVEHLRENSSELEHLAVVSPGPAALGVDAGADVVTSFAVTENYFDLLRLTPAEGRFFAPDEARFPRVQSVAVVSHRFALRRFESAPAAVGATIRVNSHPVRIVGVAPEGFGGHAVGLKADVWVPVGLPAPGFHSATALLDPESGVVETLGRLAPGSTPERARAELGPLATAFLEQARGRTLERPYEMIVESWSPAPIGVRAGVRAFLAVLMVLVGLVLGMACLNVSGMLLSRIAERTPELSVRRVLGAGRRRVVAQLLNEALVLYAAGAIGGILLAAGATRLLLSLQPPVPIPGFDIELDLGIDWRVIGFATLAALITGILFSLGPALQGARRDLSPSLARGGATPGSRFRALIVAAQMATTVLLLVGAGLFVRALGSLRSIDTGWDAARVTVMNFDLELSGYGPDDGPAFYRAMRERVLALPGVEAAGFAAKLPLAGRSNFGDVRVPGVAPPPGRDGFEAWNNTVSPGYFEAVGLEIVDGRGFDDTDRGPVRSAVINETMARRLWPGLSPVGGAFEIGTTEYRVVGVVRDAKYNRLIEETPNFYYVAAGQRYVSQAVLHVRGSPEGSVGGGPPSATTLRALALQVDGELPLLPTRPLVDALGVFLLPQRLAAWVAGLMGILALFLGVVGVYGITAFTVAERTREIGIRLALGARRSAVVRTMMRRALLAPLLGLAVGLAAAAAATRFLASFLADVSPHDPLTFVLVAGGLGLIAGLAVFIPTRRASALDPAKTLRAD